jgi:hypothetical protein
VRTSRPLTGRLTVEGRARYRDGRYADPDRIGGVTTRRKDQLVEGTLAVRYRLSKDWSVLAEARHARNNSNFEYYEYRRSTGVLGIELAM